jgi:iron complex transport system substrate-binding protein
MRFGRFFGGDTGGYPHPRFVARGCDTSLTRDYRMTTNRLQNVRWLMALILCLMGMGMVVSVGAQDAESVVVTDAAGNEVTITDTSRIITIDGSVTEIVFALGASDKVVARDDSSLYPPQVNALESVGYVRQLSAEPVLSLNPTLIITTTSAGPVEAVEQLTTSGVTILTVPAATTVEGVVANVTTIAAALSLEAEGAALVERIESDYAAAQELQATVETKPRVMFIYARGAGAVSVAGTNTSAAAMIELAGGENAVTEYEGYKPITAEAVVAVAPDVIMMMTGRLESIGGVDGLLEQPGIAQTPAGENRRIVAMEDLYLLGFSTRTGTAVLDLTYLLHEELEPPMLTLLRADGRFNTLLRALEIGGQDELLSGEGPYTLFAPTDEAIAAAFPPEVLEGFFGSTISVQATFAYHLLEGAHTAEDLAALDGETVQTLYSNGVLNISTDDSGVVLNETVHIATPDLIAANGVIHVIDGMLLPPRS